MLTLTGSGKCAKWSASRIWMPESDLWLECLTIFYRVFRLPRDSSFLCHSPLTKPSSVFISRQSTPRRVTRLAWSQNKLRARHAFRAPSDTGSTWVLVFTLWFLQSKSAVATRRATQHSRQSVDTTSALATHNALIQHREVCPPRKYMYSVFVPGLYWVHVNHVMCMCVCFRRFIKYYTHDFVKLYIHVLILLIQDWKNSISYRWISSTYKLEFIRLIPSRGLRFCLRFVVRQTSPSTQITSREARTRRHLSLLALLRLFSASRRVFSISLRQFNRAEIRVDGCCPL